MNGKFVAVLTLCLLATATAFAQSTRIDDIEGAGTPGYVPVFTGSHKIGNSIVYEANGDLGIGTTTPDSTLRVFNTLNANNVYGLEPYGIYATLQNSTINFSAAIRGDALGQSGGVAGVIGLSNSHDGYGVNGVSVNSEGGGYGVVGSLAATSLRTLEGSPRRRLSRRRKLASKSSSPRMAAAVMAVT